MAVKLQDEAALGRAPGIRVARSVPSGDVTELARAGQAISQDLTKIGGIFEKRVNDADAFDAHARLIDFQDQWTKALMDRQQKAEPGAAGFADAIKGDYIEGAKEFFATLPKHLRAEYDGRLRLLESRLTTAAKQFQDKESERFTLGRIDDATGKLATQTHQNPAAVSRALKEAEDLIDASTLSPQQKEIQKRKYREILSIAGVQGDIDSSPDRALEWSRAPFRGAYADKLGKPESGNDYGVKPNADSGARGRYQFIRDTFVPLAREVEPERTKGMTDDQVWALAQGKENAAIQDKVFSVFTGKNERALQAAGIPVNDTTRYVMHWFGSGDGVSILKADKNTPIDEFLPKGRTPTGKTWAEANGVAGKTVGQVLDIAAKRMSADVPPTAPTADQPGRRQIVVPEGVSYDSYLKLRSYADARLREQRSDLADQARVVEQDVFLGRRDPTELAGVAAGYKRLGMQAEANYYDYLAARPDMIKQWAQAGSDEQRAMIMRARDVLGSAAGVKAGEDKERIKVLGDLAKENFGRIKEALSAGSRVDQQTALIEETYAIAKATGNAKLVGEIERTVNDQRMVESLRSMPTSAQEDALRRARTQVSEEGTSPAPESFALVDKLEKEYRKHNDAMKKDGFAAGSDRFSLQVQSMPNVAQGTPQTIDALRTRAMQASAIAAKEPEHAATMAPFTNEEISGLAAAIESAPAVVKGQMLTNLANGLGPRWFGQTMLRLSKDGHQALAAAGGLMDVNPAAGRAVLSGLEIMKNNPKIVPSGTDMRTRFMDYVGNAFGFDESGAATQAMLSEAVNAAYAKFAFEAGKTDGKYDDAIADKALKLVVGKVITYKGQNIIPPKPDMTSSEWRDRVVARISDADVPDNLRTFRPGGVGDRITAETLRNSGHFFSVGDGVYVVRMLDKDGTLKEIPDPDPVKRARGMAWRLDVRPILARTPETPPAREPARLRDPLAPPSIPAQRPYGTTPGGMPPR